MVAPLRPATPARLSVVRREREVEARRADILSAARTVFAHRGYSGATLDEIASRAAFAKGTLYNYFDSKRELFRAVVLSVLDDITEIARASVRAGGGTEDVFLRYAASTIDYYKCNREILQIVAREIIPAAVQRGGRHMEQFIEKSNAISTVLAAVLRKDIREKRVIAHDPEAMAQVFLSLLHHRTIQYFFHGKSIRDVNTHEEAAFVTHLFFRGVLVERPH